VLLIERLLAFLLAPLLEVLREARPGTLHPPAHPLADALGRPREGEARRQHDRGGEEHARGHRRAERRQERDQPARDARAEITPRGEGLAAEPHEPEEQVEERREREEQDEPSEEPPVRRRGALPAEPRPSGHGEDHRDQERGETHDLEQHLRERGADASDRVRGGGRRGLRVEPRRVRRVVRRERQRGHGGEEEQEKPGDLVEPALLAETGEGDVHRGAQSTTRPRPG
jgi:hypothetical protein